MVRWYKLTFAISRKRDSRSLQCFTTTINLCPKDLLCSLSWVPMAVLTKVGVGFLRCHFSCYLLARRITFLSGITRSTGSAFAGAEGKLFLWWKAAKWPITHSPYLYTRPNGSEGMRASQYSRFIDQNTLKCIPPEDKERSDIRGTFHGMSICISQKLRRPAVCDLTKKRNVNKPGEKQNGY